MPPWLVRRSSSSQAPRPSPARARRSTSASPPAPDGARVFHVGVMLGRAEPFLRAQVVNVEPHDVGGYLQRLGWRWDVEVPVGLAYALRPLAHRLALCVPSASACRRRSGL